MKKYIKIFMQCALFDDCTQAEVEQLLPCLGAKLQTYRRNEMILSEGDATGKIGILVEGSASISSVDVFGRRSINAVVHPGEMFAETFACAALTKIPVDVISRENSTVIFLDYARLVNPCRENCGCHRNLSHNLMRIIASKNLLFHQKLQILSKRSTREKLLAYLQLTAKQKQSLRFEIPFNRNELADYLECDRSGLSQELSKLQKEGVLCYHRSWFSLLQEPNK